MYLVVLTHDIEDLETWETLGAEEKPDGTHVYFSNRLAAKAFARRYGARVQVAVWNIDLSYQDAWELSAVGKRFCLVPEGQASPAGKLALTMKRGLVFGAGDHETTRGCLELLENLPLAGKAVFDLGSGTGILAEAAQLLGAKTVVACDLESDAARMTRDRGVASFQGPSQALKDQSFEVLLANIPGLAHLELVAEYQRLLVPGGHLILSGYYETQAERLEAALCGFRKLAQRPNRDGWVAATFSKTSQA